MRRPAAEVPSAAVFALRPYAPDAYVAPVVGDADTRQVLRQRVQHDHQLWLDRGIDIACWSVNDDTGALEVGVRAPTAAEAQRPLREAYGDDTAVYEADVEPPILRMRSEDEIPPDGYAVRVVYLVQTKDGTHVGCFSTVAEAERLVVRSDQREPPLQIHAVRVHERLEHWEWDSTVP